MSRHLRHDVMFLQEHSPRFLSVADRNETFRPYLARGEPIDVAPHPNFARFDGAHQRMLALVEMLGRMLVLGRVTATNISALQTQPKMHPTVSHFDAFFADVFVCAGDFYLVQMRARSCHAIP